MLISVIVTFFNQAAYVKRALDSVLVQSYNSLEIIVVDDGSTDETAEEVKKINDPRVTFFQRENGGAASARNFGIREAKGVYIAFLDGDDVFLPTKIEVMVERLSEQDYPVCAMVSGYYEVTMSGKLAALFRQPERITDPEHDPVSAFPNMRPSMVIYHRDIFQKLGGFPEALRINEDGAFNLRVFRTYPVHCISEVLVLWQGDDQGKSRKVLQDYDTAFQTMEKKVAYLKEWIGHSDAFAYRKLHIRNNLCGFLSINRLDIARRWYPLMWQSGVAPDTAGAKLAAVSVRSGVNVYLPARCLLRSISAWRLRGEARALRTLLNKW